VLPGTLMTDPRFFYASPAYLVDVVDSELLLAGHLTNHRDTSINRQVSIMDSLGNDHTFDGSELRNSYDGEDRRVTLLDITGSDLSTAATTTYSARFDNLVGLPGGLGSFVEYLIEQSSYPIDRSRTLAARSYLDRVRVGGVVDVPIGPLELFREAVQPIFPVALHSGPDGVFPVYYPECRAGEVLHAITAGPSFAFESREDEVDQIVNEVSVEWGWSDAEQNYTQNNTYGVDDSAHAAWSASLHGRRVGDPLRSGWISSQQTADFVALTYLRLRAGPIRRFVYRANASLFGIGAPRQLRLGDPVTLTDADRGLSVQVAAVTDLRHVNDDLTVEVTVIPDLDRDAPAT